MSIFLTNARLIDPEAQTETLGWLRLKNGTIAETGLGEAPGDGIDCGSKYLAPGIVDIGVKVSEPGERHKESFRSAGLAAAAGGVTTMVTRPDCASADGCHPGGRDTVNPAGDVKVAQDAGAPPAQAFRSVASSIVHADRKSVV